MTLDLILRIGTKLSVPFILLFALYVHMHGDYGPGGGFQAGVIGAAVVILYAIIFGIRPTMGFLPLALVERLVPLGVLVFASAGVPALLLGANYLDYGALGSDPASAHVFGILWVETGVLITVFSTVVAIFYAFAARGRP